MSASSHDLAAWDRCGRVRLASGFLERLRSFVDAFGSRLILGPSIASAAEGRGNNLNAIRLVAASLVVFSHCYPISGHLEAEPLAAASDGIIDFGTAAVMAFFVISGFLISKSAASSPSLKYFVAARFLRMWPGLLLSSLLVVLVLGPVVTHLALVDYVFSRSTWRYLVFSTSIDVGVNLPGVFFNNPVPDSVNGSLWTIQVEAWLYACMAALLFSGVARRTSWLGVAWLMAAGCFLVVPDTLLPWMVRTETVMMPRLIGCFILGALFFTHGRWIPLSPAIGVALLISAAFSITSVWFVWFLYVFFAYWVIMLAFHPLAQFAKLRFRNDYSYGIYVFAFPIQQSIVSVAGVDNPLLLFAISFPIIFSLAALSWHFVESRALALKNRFR